MKPEELRLSCESCDPTRERVPARPNVRELSEVLETVERRERIVGNPQRLQVEETAERREGGDLCSRGSKAREIGETGDRGQVCYCSPLDGEAVERKEAFKPAQVCKRAVVPEIQGLETHDVRQRSEVCERGEIDQLEGGDGCFSSQRREIAEFRSVRYLDRVEIRCACEAREPVVRDIHVAEADRAEFGDGAQGGHRVGGAQFVHLPNDRDAEEVGSSLEPCEGADAGSLTAGQLPGNS